MGVKKKLQLTSLLGFISIDHDSLVQLMGPTSDITGRFDLIFGVKFVYFFAEVIRFYRLILKLEWGLFSLRS